MITNRSSRRVAWITGMAAAAVVAAAASRGVAQEPARQRIETPAPVKVENRGATEAVPVRVEHRGPAEALPVSIQDSSVAVRTDKMPLDVAIREPQSLPVTQSSQQWSYLEIRYAAGQSPLALLQAAGRDGWEAAGVMYQLPSESAILMKRPMR